jgi:hypothetical protein
LHSQKSAICILQFPSPAPVHPFTLRPLIHQCLASPRYIVPILLLLPLIFTGGKLLLTPVWDEYNDWHLGSNIGSFPPISRGWPWIYSLDDRNFREHEPPVDRSIFVADVLCLSVTGLLIWFAAVRLWQKKAFRLTFSLRALFALISILAIILAWLTTTYRGWKTEQRFVADAQQHHVITRTDYVGPEWLRRLIDKKSLEIFWRVTWVEGAHDDDDLKIIGTFPHLWELKLQAPYPRGVKQEPNVSDVGVSYLVNCHELRTFDSLGANLERITDQGLDVLVKLATLQFLDLRSASVSDLGIRRLKDLSHLKTLMLSDTSVTDNGIEGLKHLSHLKTLALSNTPITDASFDTLVQIRSLKSLDLTNCKQLKNLDRLFELRSLESRDGGVVYLSESQRALFSESDFRYVWPSGTPELYIRFDGRESWLHIPLESAKVK